MKPICTLLDNARIHIAKKFRAFAQEIDIHLIYNILYSPDSNPIKFGWKDFKRDISKYINFNEAIIRSHDCALEKFCIKSCLSGLDSQCDSKMRLANSWVPEDDTHCIMDEL